MIITVFGASGRVGRHVVALLVDQGYHVRAGIFGTPSFEPHSRIEIVQVDVHDPAQVLTALTGAEAVISTLGSWGTPTKDILSAGMTNIIPAMRQNDITRIVSLTGAEARVQSDHPNIFQKFTHSLAGILASSILKDGELHLKLLSQSGLDWTVVRSPVMTQSGLQGRYQLREELSTPWASIHRHDVASAMVDLVGNKNWVRQAPVIFRT